MAHRPFKHVLGETSLERKCRLLFGPCLFLSIVIAFVLVDYIAEDLVHESQDKVVSAARQHSEAYMDMSLLKLHFKLPLYSREEAQDVDQSRRLRPIGLHAHAAQGRTQRSIVDGDDCPEAGVVVVAEDDLLVVVLNQSIEDAHAVDVPAVGGFQQA